MNSILNLKTIVFGLLVLILATACNPKPNLNSGRAQMGSMAGVVAPGAETSSADEKKIVQKVRLREADGKKIFEYLDPQSSTEKWVAYGQVEILPAGSRFYHWGPEKDVKYWASEGIKHEDIDHAVRRRNDSDVLGGGFYASLSPVDSLDYGEKVVVIEPQQDVTTLQVIRWDYNRELRAIVDTTSGNLIPVPLVAEAGIETLRYSGTWMVCISGKPLQNLLEGSWDVFLFQHQQKSLSLIDALKLSMRYEITPEIVARPEFAKSFPMLAQFKSQGAISDELLEQFADAYVMDSSFSIQNAPPVWKDLLTAAKGHIQKKLAAKLNENSAANNFMFIEFVLAPKLSGLGFGFKDLIQGFSPMIDSKFLTTNNEENIQVKHSAELVRLHQFFSVTHFYEALDSLVKGQSDLKSLLNPRGGRAPGEELSQKIYSMGRSSDIETNLNDFASLWSENGLQWREKAAHAYGEHLLDGPSKPGFLRITELQKKELESNPFIDPTFRLISDQNGQSEIYVQYELPSAKNFQKFKSHIQSPELVARLETAERSGQLNDVNSEIFAQLTKDVTKEIVKSIFSKNQFSYVKLFVELNRVQPFADAYLGEKILRTQLWSKSYGTVFYLDSDQLKVATPIEAIESHLISRNFLTHTLFRSVQTTSAPNNHSSSFNPHTEIGVWEIAANRPGPHKDPAKFIQKVKARFESAEVQAWLKDRSFHRIRRALHEAGAE